MSRGSIPLALALLAAALIVMAAGALSSAGAAAPVRAHAAWQAQCRDPYPAWRNPSNPLMLAAAPGADPLNGARFFVDGPRHGEAASTIARLLGVDPSSYPDDFSWARFKADLDAGGLHRRLMAASASVRWRVGMLEKVADQPEAQRFSAFSEGGGPGKIFSQVQKIFCYNLTADPGTVPIITTYFLHPDAGHCPSASGVRRAWPTFKRQIDEMAAGTGNRPAVYLLELDAIGSSRCMAVNRDLPQYLSLLRYEARTIAALPHTVVYIEAGYSDANSASYTARALNEAGVRGVRGFFTNDTHLNWTISEVRWAQQIARRTHGTHFIVNTAQNGHGPLRNRRPSTQGNEDLCNPPGRGLGPTDTTATRFAYADAFLWTHVPGNSSGCGGGPPGGVFWPARAISLAARADDRLGPGYPNRPY